LIFLPPRFCCFSPRCCIVVPDVVVVSSPDVVVVLVPDVVVVSAPDVVVLPPDVIF